MVRNMVLDELKFVAVMRPRASDWMISFACGRLDRVKIRLSAFLAN